jgi:LacI family transcriptional regulator
MSIQALADSLGISISTVSRALNGYSDVSAATRQRVFDAAKAMNYTPHPVAHRLATGKTGAVAIVNSARTISSSDGTSAALHTGVAEILRMNNYFAMSMNLPTDEAELPELIRLLDGRLVDGIILTRTRTNDPRVKLLQERKIPFVTYGRTLENAPHAWVDSDNAGSFDLATQALIQRGHRRIALINGMPHMTFATLREQGFRKALADAEIDVNQCPIHYTELTGASGQHIARLLLAQKPRPTALVCAMDAIAVGAMAAIREAGLKVGADVSVIGFGNTEMGLLTDPPLSSMKHDIVDNGRQLAHHILRLLAGENSARLQVLEAPQLYLRGSVAEVKA